MKKLNWFDNKKGDFKMKKLLLILLLLAFTISANNRVVVLLVGIEGSPALTAQQTSSTIDSLRKINKDIGMVLIDARPNDISRMDYSDTSRINAIARRMKGDRVLFSYYLVFVNNNTEVYDIIYAHERGYFKVIKMDVASGRILARNYINRHTHNINDIDDMGIGEYEPLPIPTIRQRYAVAQNTTPPQQQQPAVSRPQTTAQN